MKIVLDSTSSVGNQKNGSGWSWNHTIGSGNGRLLVVCTGFYDGGGGYSTTSVTFNGVSLTKATGSSSGGHYADIWYLINPPVGTYAIVVNLNIGSGLSSAGAVSFRGVKAYGQPDNTASAGGSGTPSCNITPKKSACVLVDSFVENGGGYTVGTGQTQIYQQYLTRDDDVVGASFKITTTDGVQNMYWGSGSGGWSQYVASFGAKTSGANILFELL